MTQLFDIPEILYLICERVGRSNLAGILTVSRLFFDCSMPLVWGDLPESAPVILLNLLPDGDKYVYNYLNSKFTKSLKPLDERSLVRFKIYALHVKRLTRHRTNKQLNILWDRLLKLVDARPILPNLEVLKVSLDINGEVTLDPIPYLSAFLSPSMIEIHQVREAYTSIKSQSLSDLVSRIAQECPHLQFLKLGNVTRFTVTKTPQTADELAKSLSQLRELRILSLGPAVLKSKVLMALSTLPKLEYIILNEPYKSKGGKGMPRAGNLSFSDDSFPALRHLEIRPCFDPETAARIWSVTSLVRPLTSISVRMVTEATESKIYDFFRPICRRCPFITTLSLNFMDVENDITLLSPQLINILAQLPLQRLCLRGRNRCYNDWDSDNFALALPMLEYLEIRGYDFAFRDLACIAKHMPRLHQLSVSVGMDRVWPLQDELSSMALTPSPSLLHFRIQSFRYALWDRVEIRAELTTEESDGIAGCLHSLWPEGLTCETYQRAGQGGGDWRCVNLVNTALRRLQEAKGLKSTGHPTEAASQADSPLTMT